MRSNIALFTVCIVALLIIVGFFKGFSSFGFAHVAVLVMSASLLCYIGLKQVYFEVPESRDRDMHGRKISYDGLVAGLLGIVVFKAAFLAIAGNSFDSYPVDILLLIILSYALPLVSALVCAGFSAGLDIAHTSVHGIAPVLSWSAFKVTLMIGTVFAVNVTFQHERKKSNRFHGMLKAREASARGLAMDAQGRGSVLSAVSKEGQERISYDSAYEMSDSVSGMLDTLKKVLSCHNALLFGIEGNRLTLMGAASSNDLCYELPNESTENLLGWIAEHKIPLSVAQVREKKGVAYYAHDPGVNSFAGVPLFGEGDELKGILCVDSLTEDAFHQEEERLLILAARGVSGFLKHAAVLHQMKVETSEFAAFYRLSKKLGSTIILEDILTIAIDSSKEIVDYDMAAFVFREDVGSGKVITAKGFKAQDLAGKSFVLEDTVSGWTMKNARPLVLPDIRKGKRDVPIFPGVHFPVHSVLCLPLLIKDDPIGVFVLASKTENFFSSYEMKILEVVASHISIAISNARIYLQMERMAITDGLTGLYNHKHFQEKLAQEIERAGRYDEKVSLLLVDIDYFKKVNDTYGHPAGDKILKEVAGILSESIRSVDLAARYGGEEFALILVSTDGKGALDTAERIRGLMERGRYDIGGACINITGSMGISVFPDDGERSDQAGTQRLLISKADSALYLAKKEGRNRAYLFKNVVDRIEKLETER